MGRSSSLYVPHHLCKSSSPSNLQHRKLRRLKKDLESIQESINSLDKNTCRLQMYQEQLLEFKRELVEIHDALLSMGVADTADLMTMHGTLEKGIFDSSLLIRQLLHVHKGGASSSAVIDGKGPNWMFLHLTGTLLVGKTFGNNSVCLCMIVPT